MQIQYGQSEQQEALEVISTGETVGNGGKESVEDEGEFVPRKGRLRVTSSVRVVPQAPCVMCSGSL
jgi:hypothetical protein